MKYGDVEAMADAVIALYNDRQLLVTKGANAAALISNFDVSVIAPKLYAVINTVLLSN